MPLKPDWNLSDSAKSIADLLRWDYYNPLEDGEDDNPEGCNKFVLWSRVRTVLYRMRAAGCNRTIHMGTCTIPLHSEAEGERDY